MSPRRRTAILISGRGSNMTALIGAARALDFPAEIALVLSNKSSAGGLALARQAGVAAAVVDHKIYAGRDEFEGSMQAMLDIHRIDLICLAGFMRILSAPFVARWQGRILNIHPSLLPSFRGLDTHARAIEAGVKLHGCTVHFVEPELDSGPIIAQAAVEVRDDDTPETLGARVLIQEHALYPAALALVAAGRVETVGARTRVAPAP
ncbi:MAG TPA: phosphoribosylglycinamide formyltransferase [Roseiarcus sp.]